MRLKMITLIAVFALIVGNVQIAFADDVTQDGEGQNETTLADDGDVTMDDDGSEEPSGGSWTDNSRKDTNDATPPNVVTIEPRTSSDEPDETYVPSDSSDSDSSGSNSNNGSPGGESSHSSGGESSYSSGNSSSGGASYVNVAPHTPPASDGQVVQSPQTADNRSAIPFVALIASILGIVELVILKKRYN